jgi:hypothetical protein
VREKEETSATEVLGVYRRYSMLSSEGEPRLEGGREGGREEEREGGREGKKS